MQKNKRILITGAHGFLGGHLLANLKQRGYKHLITPTRREYDLCSKTQIQKLFKDASPEVVIHGAARVGGIGFNQKNPGSFFYENAIMALELMEVARLSNVEKFLCLGSVCSYPKWAKVPFKEETIWEGYPEETNAPYGLAKKMMLVQAQAYRKQYNFNAVYLIPVNMYGPGDNFNLDTSHVIPALIRKFITALDKNQPSVEIWGDGSASREFLYIDDCAEAICLAMEQYEKSDPVNLGTGHEITIKDLTSQVKELVGYQGKIAWDKTRPNGQPRRSLDVSRAQKEFHFKAKVTLAEGLKRTVDWYRQHPAS